MIIKKIFHNFSFPLFVIKAWNILNKTSKLFVNVLSNLIVLDGIGYRKKNYMKKLLSPLNLSLSLRYRKKWKKASNKKTIYSY